MRLISTAAAIAVAAGLIGSAGAQVSPIDVMGWNHDLVINGSAPYNTSVTGTMDGGLGQFENWTWVEQGTYTNVQGVAQQFQGLVAGTHQSLTGNGSFMFQPFSENNVLALDGGITGTLTLAAPAPYQSIALYGASGFGAKTAEITLQFADGSTTTFTVGSGEGIGTDWFNSEPDKAYIAGARASNRNEEGFTRLYYQENSLIGINESFFELDAADHGKLLTSVSVQNTGGDRMAIFAVSGQLVPEPAAAGLLLGVGLLGLARRR